VFDLLANLVAVFGKDLKEAREGFRSKILIAVFLSAVFYGETIVDWSVNGIGYTAAWVRTVAGGDTWTPEQRHRDFILDRQRDFESFLNNDRRYWTDGEALSAPWPLAQNVLAAPALAARDRQRVLDAITAATMPGCMCWSETGFQRHTASSAWTAAALAELNGEQADAALDDLLAGQSREGWWQMFPSASPDAGHASTYATVTALMAILAHRRAGRLSGERGVEAQAAAERAVEWLLETFDPRAGGWSDYPNARQGRVLASGLSAQVLWTLHQTLPATRLAEADRAFVAAADLMPDLKDFEMSDVQIVFGGRSLDYDNTRYASFPWTLLAMVEAYPNLPDPERVRVRLAIDALLDRRAWDAREPDREYMLVEVLFALRMVAAKGAVRGRG
jgi:hypothetical protein